MKAKYYELKLKKQLNKMAKLSKEKRVSYAKGVKEYAHQLWLEEKITDDFYLSNFTNNVLTGQKWWE